MSSKSISFTEILMLLLLGIFLFTPFSSLQRVIFIYSVFGVWLFSSMIKDSSWILEAKTQVVLISIIALLHFVVSLHTDSTFSHFIAFNLPTYLWCLVFVYYSRHCEDYKKLLVPTFIIVLISSILTIRANLILPGASRYLATASDSSWGSLRESANSLFAGGYSFIFSLVFLAMPLILMHKSHLVRKQWLFWLIYCCMAACVIVGSYFTAILLFLLVSILSFSRISSTGKTILSIIIVGLLFLALKDFFLQSLIDLGNTIGSPMLTRRAEQMLYGTYVSDYEGTDDSRIERAYNALHNFAQSPIFGRLFGEIPNKLESDHSELLGYMENFGLFSVFYFFFYKKIFSTVYSKINGKEYRKYYSLFFCVFILFLLIDKFDIATGTAAIVFFIAPMLFLVIDFNAQ